jgi:hypothetical protein
MPEGMTGGFMLGSSGLEFCVGEIRKVVWGVC